MCSLEGCCPTAGPKPRSIEGGSGGSSEIRTRAPLAQPSAFEAVPIDQLWHPSEMAERQGFEPWCRIPAAICFPSSALGPLGHLSSCVGGRREIRTHERGVSPSPVFKTGAISRSASLPKKWWTEQGSNLRRLRLQRSALPAELSVLVSPGYHSPDSRTRCAKSISWARRRAPRGGLCLPAPTLSTRAAMARTIGLRSFGARCTLG